MHIAVFPLWRPTGVADRVVAVEIGAGETPYAPEERYAASDYPNQSEPGQGLPAWTAESRDIQNQDLVLWYTMGFHHVPSSEDWPVYNLGWHSVTLKPYNFFDRNPALDVPPVQSEESAGDAGRQAIN